MIDLQSFSATYITFHFAGTATLGSFPPVAQAVYRANTPAIAVTYVEVGKRPPSVTHRQGQHHQHSRQQTCTGIER